MTCHAGLSQSQSNRLSLIALCLIACNSSALTTGLTDGGASSGDVCSLPDPPLQGETIADACARMTDARLAWYARAFLPGYPIDRASAVASCIGIATLPGSRVSVSDLEALRSKLLLACTSVVVGSPSSIGYAWNLLSPAATSAGTRSAGEKCHADIQCASLRCNIDHLSPTYCGRCVIPRAIGDRCNPDLDLCGPIASCEDGICVASGKKLGVQCTTKFEECQPDLYCAKDVCVKRGTSGDACARYDGCLADPLHPLMCKAGVCQPVRLLADGSPCPDPDLDRCTGACHDGVCVPFPFNLGVGADCSIGRCREDLSCNMSHVCAQWTSLNQGDVCTAYCSPTLECST